MLCMTLAVCQAYAQEESVDTISTPQQESTLSLKDLRIDELISLLNEMKSDESDKPIFVPVMGKRKFARKHYIYQTFELSTLMGKDRDSDDAGGAASARGNGNGAPGFVADMNIGLNVGYSLMFVPGKVEGDQLRLNRFGFGYGTGIVASFDHQNQYDVTCDFLLKFGVETGVGRPFGIGLDFLVGGGKTARTEYQFDIDKAEADATGNTDGNEDGQTVLAPDEDDYEDDPECSTEWCWKYGAQLWVKTNFLQTKMKNTDVLMFVRYVRSVDKYSMDDQINLFNAGILTLFPEESWQFGITVRHRF